MTKKEIFAEAMELCKTNGATDTLVAGLTTLLEPKKGGAPFNIDEVTVRDGNDVITYIFDSVFKLWVPVYDDAGEANFYEKPDTELGWSRFSKAAEKARKDADKAYKATKDAVLTDLLDGNVSAEDAQATMAEADVARKELAVEEGFGVSEKPE